MSAAVLRRHWDVLTVSWAEESKRRREERLKRESHEFLPAALEVLERPPSPIGLMIVWILLAIIGAAMLWAVFGKLDVVASAQGKIIPVDKVKVLQSADGGIVRAIHVRDGQRVRKGQVLIDLDPTQSGADKAQAASALGAAKVAGAYAQALLDYAHTGRIAFKAPEGTPVEIAQTQQDLLRAAAAEYQAQVADLQERGAESRALAAQSEKEVSKLQATLPLLKERVTRRKSLADRGLSSKLLQLEIEQQQIEHEREIGVQAENGARYRATQASTSAQIAALKQGFVRQAAEALAKAQDEIRLRQEELTKATQRNGLQRLRAPVDGTVQQLTVATIGAVIKPADPIMMVVPLNGTLEVEAMIANKDIGHVRVGQEVAIKLEAFSFTDYGTVPGHLVQISPDAIQDEKQGLIYQARIRLDRSTIDVDGRSMPLAPGLAATADIHTGSRRIISYLLSPLSRRAQEAGRER